MVWAEITNSAHTTQWRARIGISTGAVIGSLVGIQKYAYDLFGQGVNLAARMESLAEPIQIVASARSHDLFKDEFALGDLGEQDIKGFGTQRVYSLDRELRLRY